MEKKKDGHPNGEICARPVNAAENNVEGLFGRFWATRDPETAELIFHVELRHATNPMRANFEECIQFVAAVLGHLADSEGVFAPTEEELEEGLYDGFDWIEECL